MAKQRQPEVTTVEFLAAIEKPNLRVIERATVEGHDVMGYTDGDEITIGRRIHGGSGNAQGHELVATLIHEMVHHLRPAAGEKWVRRRELALFADDKVRAAAAIRLLNAVLFDAD